MEINGNIPSLLGLTLSPLKNHAWREGQILQAVVVRQLAAELTLLQIGNKQVQAETPRPLPPGTHLKLEVINLGEKPILKVINQQPPNTQLAPQKNEQTFNQAIKQALPRQSSILPLLANLSLINLNKNPSPALPSAVQAIAAEILSKLPTRDKIKTADGLKQAIKDSGIFLENKLQQAAKKPVPLNPTSSSHASSKSPPTLDGLKTATEQIKIPTAQSPIAQKPSGIESDIKGLLLRLITVIQSQAGRKEGQVNRPGIAAQPPLTTTLGEDISKSLIPPLTGNKPQPQRQAQPTLSNMSSALNVLQELGKQTEGSLARTQLNQIASMPAAEQNPAAWSLELPIKNQEAIDLFHMVIEEGNEEKSEKDKKSRKWSVMIAVELGEMGPLHIKLQLENEQISTIFWAEKQETSTLINTYMGELARRYKKSGIESSQLHCFHGEPPEGSTKHTPIVVLDVNA
ncbi:flagellar hook-length control protein FliK [Pseudomonadota bacterium]